MVKTRKKNNYRFWLIAVIGTTGWIFFHWVLFVRGHTEDTSRLLVGALILTLIIVFYSTVDEGWKNNNDESYSPGYILLLIGIVWILGLIASWLSITPGLGRAFGAFLIACENLVVCCIVDEINWNGTWRKISIAAFFPIGILFMSGLIELGFQFIGPRG